MDDTLITEIKQRAETFCKDNRIQDPFHKQAIETAMVIGASIVLEQLAHIQTELLNLPPTE